MKRTSIAAALALSALPLLAGEPQATSTQPPAESPLVAAAKASGRMNPSKTKKKIVITNDNLVKSGGHITTSSRVPPPLPPPSHTDPEMDRLAKQRQQEYIAKVAAEAKAKRDAEEKRRALAERANAIYEGDDPAGIYEDPAAAEGRAESQSPAPPGQPPTMKVQKPPL